MALRELGFAAVLEDPRGEGGCGRSNNRRRIISDALESRWHYYTWGFKSFPYGFAWPNIHCFVLANQLRRKRYELARFTADVCWVLSSWEIKILEIVPAGIDARHRVCTHNEHLPFLC